MGSCLLNFFLVASKLLIRWDFCRFFKVLLEQLLKFLLKALSQLLGKLADKALASLPGIIGSIISWILNRAKEVVGWLSQNLWALITGVGVLIYTYFMTKTNRR